MNGCPIKDNAKTKHVSTAYACDTEVCVPAYVGGGEVFSKQASDDTGGNLYFPGGHHGVSQ